MAKNVERLKAITVGRKLAPGMYPDGAGLYLQVGAGGGKSWIFRYMLSGTARHMGLGSCPDVSLAEARDLARAARRLRAEGVDPIKARGERRAKERLDAAKATTFKNAAEAYIEAHKAGWRNQKHAAQWPSSLEAYAYPVFGTIPVQDVDTGLVMKVLEAIWQEKPETASRVRGRIEAVLDWATARGLREGENPARWRGHIKNLLPAKSKVRAVQHHPALPYKEVAEFIMALDDQQGVEGTNGLVRQ